MLEFHVKRELYWDGKKLHFHSNAVDSRKRNRSVHNNSSELANGGDYF
jgi:hypothetical protein